MRKLLLPILIFLVACNSKKDDKKIETNENTDLLVTMEGIGPVKTDMSQEELERVLNQKVPLTNLTDSVSGSWQDSARIQYKGAEINLSFVRTQTKTIDSFFLRVTRMQTNSPLFKTKNGIGIGSSKQQVLDAFENYMLIINPDYTDTSYNTRSKTMLWITVRESYEGGEIVFYLKDKKVYSIEVGNFYDDSE